MKLTKKLKKLFEKAFLSAFNSYSELERMFDYELDVELNTISNPNKTMLDIISDIRKWAKNNNKFFETINAALEQVSGNVKLNELKNELNLFIDESKKNKKNLIKNKGESTIIQGLNNVNDLNVIIHSNVDSLAKKNNENTENIKKKVLMIFSTPKNELSIRFDDEVHIVEGKLENSKIYSLAKTKFKVENTEIAPIIITEQANIVHFSLHGQQNTGLIFTDKANEKVIVDINEFKTWFDLLNDIKIDCYIFNACHSSEFAKLASKYSDYAIGMNDIILEPDAALTFSEGFYSILKVKNDIKSAFMSGVNLLYSKRVNLETRDKKEQHRIPELYVNGELYMNFNLMQQKS